MWRLRWDIYSIENFGAQPGCGNWSEIYIPLKTSVRFQASLSGGKDKKTNVETGWVRSHGRPKSIEERGGKLLASLYRNISLKNKLSLSCEGWISYSNTTQDFSRKTILFIYISPCYRTLIWYIYKYLERNSKDNLEYFYFFIYQFLINKK